MPARKSHEEVYARIAQQGGRGWDDRLPDGADEGSYRALEAFLAAHPRPAPGAAALEVGCGGGQAALRLAAHGYRVSGIDEAPTAIRLARENAAEAGLELELCVGDACELPRHYDPGSLDLVVDNHVLHCLVADEDRHAFLRGIHTVLRVGGCFFSETMSSEGAFDPAFVQADPATRIARSGTRRWCSEQELDEELRRAGFVRFDRHRREEGSLGGTLIVTIASKS